MSSAHFTIEISRYPVFMYLGVFSQEKLCGQTVLLDVTLEVKSSNKSRVKLEETVDYSQVIGVIDDELRCQEEELIENALNRVAYKLKESFPNIQFLTLCLTKPKMPQSIDRGASISVRRSYR